MNYQTVTLEIPDDLYQRLKLRAAATHQTVEAQIVQTLSAGLTVEESDLPPEFAATLAALEASDDTELLRIAATPNSPEMEASLQQLRERQQSRDISLEEKRKIEEILYQYEMKELLRAEVEEILKRRERHIDG